MPENKLSTSASPHKELSSQSDPTDSTSHFVNTESFDQSEDPYVPTWEDGSTFPSESPSGIKQHKDHPVEQVICDYDAGVQTRTQSTVNFYFYTNFLLIMKPKKTDEALRDDDWVEATQEELTEFERNKV